jgi:HAE1 family hydrophobic/amphiphilic exporter-1
LAVLFSSLVALTLTPAMGSWLMRAVDKPNALTATLDKGLGWVEERYRRVLGAVLRRAVWMPWCCCSASAALAPFWQLPASLTPTEDRACSMCS